MACSSCSKRAAPGGRPPVPAGPETVVVFYAVAPDGTEHRYTSKVMARSRARRGGGGWSIEPRTEMRSDAPAEA